MSKRAALLLAAALVTQSAAAQDRASAEELFQLGKGAMSRRDYPNACKYFQASLNADFALGTLLNLAICHEEAGKIASAWGEFRTLEDRARRANPPQTDRAQFAHDRAEALRPRLSRVRILVSPEAAALSGLVVKIDNVVAAPELFEAGVPVDPGRRKVTATAPDHVEWSQPLAVDDERLKLEVTVPALKRGSAPAKQEAKSTVELAELERISAERSQRTVGFVVGGIGVAALGTGAVFGLLAVGASDDAKCPAVCYATTPEGGRNPALDAASDGYSRANTYAWVSNVALLTGVIGVGIGAYLVLTAKSKAAPAAAVLQHFQPTALRQGAGLTFGGTL